MREILFRAYDKTMKRYKQFDGEHDTMLISRDGKIDYYNLQNGSGFDEYILEQFTGLLDKNGNKIFEGDIVVCRYANEYTPVFQNGIYMAYNPKEIQQPSTQFNIIWRNGCEVIGNIHDNPELLENK